MSVCISVLILHPRNLKAEKELKTEFLRSFAMKNLLIKLFETFNENVPFHIKDKSSALRNNYLKVRLEVSGPTCLPKTYGIS